MLLFPDTRDGRTYPDPQMRRNGALILLDFAAGLTVEAQPRRDMREVLPDLIGALEDPDELVRSWTAQTIGYIGPAAGIAVPDLIKVLSNDDEASRNGGCFALGQIGSAAKDALPALRRMLDDPRENVRRFAKIAIDRIEQK